MSKVLKIIALTLVLISSSVQTRRRHWQPQPYWRRRQDVLPTYSYVPQVTSVTAGHFGPLDHHTPPNIACGESRQIGLHDSVFIQSPNYSRGRKKYPNSITCKWNFSLQNCTLAFKCPNFELNKFLCMDYLEISDVQGKSHRFCGNQGPRGIYLDTDVQIVFRSSATFNAPGFRCFATCIAPGSVQQLSRSSIPSPSSNHRICACGKRPNVKPQISKSGYIERLPWTSRIVRKLDGSFICSATLISSQYLVTSAHCFANEDTKSAEDVMVILSEKSRQEAGVPKHRLRSVSHIHKYLEEAHGPTVPELDADIALVKLQEPIDFNAERRDLSPICLPKREDAAELRIGSIAYLSRWQWDADWHDQHLVTSKSIVLHEDNCTLNSLNAFASFKRDGTWVASPKTWTVCVKSLNPICQPVLGSQLSSVEAKGRRLKHTLVGVGTWGSHCDKENKATTHRFVPISQVVDWILENTRDSVFCPA